MQESFPAESEFLCRAVLRSTEAERGWGRRERGDAGGDTALNEAVYTLLLSGIQSPLEVGFWVHTRGI